MNSPQSAEWGPRRAGAVVSLLLLAGSASAALPPWFVALAPDRIGRPDHVELRGEWLYLCWLRRTARGTLTPDWAGIKAPVAADSGPPWDEAEHPRCDPAGWWVP